MKKWTDQEIKELIKLKSEGLTKREIAKILGRTFDSVKHALNRYASDVYINANIENITLKKKDLPEIIRKIGEEIYNKFEPYKLPIPKPLKSKQKREEHSILDISDVHVGMINEVFDSEKGKKIVTYNLEIFKKELEQLQNAVFKIYNILKHSYRLRELTIFVLGDILTNDRIFEGQQWEIEQAVGEQLWTAVNGFISFFNNLLRIYEKITIVGVVGNHGRSSGNSADEEPVQNNFEYHLYKIWQKQFENNPRINVIIPDTRIYIHKIYDWKHLITHGDFMRGYSDNYIEKQIKELTLNVGGFDAVHFGHFHKLKEREIADKVLVKQNGAWIFRDSFSLRVFKTYSIPKQFFWGCSPKRVETWSYKIDLRIKEHYE